MAIGIEKTEIGEVWTIPLISGNDSEWQDNTWFIEHLRHLADKIEKQNPRVFSVGVDFNVNYKIPILRIETL